MDGLGSPRKTKDGLRTELHFDAAHHKYLAYPPTEANFTPDFATPCSESQKRSSVSPRSGIIQPPARSLRAPSGRSSRCFSVSRIAVGSPSITACISLRSTPTKTGRRSRRARTSCSARELFLMRSGPPRVTIPPSNPSIRLSSILFGDVSSMSVSSSRCARCTACLWVRLFFVGGPISLSGGGEAGGNWIRQGVVRSGGGSGGRRYFCRQRPMGDFRWSSRAS